MKHGAAALLAIVALLAGGCGSRRPPPPEAVAAPVDALRLGMQSYHDHQFIAAQQLFTKAYALYRSVDDSRGQVSALINLADVALVLGEHALARRELDEAERLIARDGLRQFGAHLKLLQAQAHLQAGAVAEARATLDALLALPDADAAIQRAATFERARLALDAGEDAGPWLDRARGALAGAEAAALRARMLRLDAEAARRGGDAARTRALLDQALELYKIDLYRPGIAATHEELGALALAAGELDAARDHYERALAIRLWLNDRVHGAAALGALATVEEAAGNAPRAGQLRDMLTYMKGAGALEWRIIQQKYEQLGK
jgi:tetratricopeptide (TPR) repeat protein